MAIRVLLVGRHPVVRLGLRSVLGAGRGLRLVGEASGVEEGIRKAARLGPDVVVLDAGLPGLRGIRELRRLASACRGLPILAFCPGRDGAELSVAGAAGHLHCAASPARIQAAVRAAGSGRVLNGQRDGRRPAARAGVPSLTLREREVLALVAEGQTNRRIASLLGVGVRTVETHRENLMSKLNIHNAVGLARYALAHAAD